MILLNLAKLYCSAVSNKEKECFCRYDHDCDIRPINGTLCSDQDECLVNNGGCQYHCINTVGSYTCSCNDGFSLSKDRHNCEGK